MSTKSSIPVRPLPYPTLPFVLALVAALLAGLWLLDSFIFVILVAFISASLTNPLYRRFLRRTKQNVALSVVLTIIIATFVIIIPLSFVLALTAWQTAQLIDTINFGSLIGTGGDVPKLFENAIQQINEFIEKSFGVSDLIKGTAVSDAIKSGFLALANGLLSAIQNIFRSIPNFFSGLVVYVFLYVGMLTQQKRLTDVLFGIMPFDKSVIESYIEKTGAMVAAMTRGQVIIAIVQGVIGALSLAAIGLGEYVFFFAIVFSFLNLIPLGSGIVLIPLGIVNILIGNIWQGLVVLLTHFLITTNIDTVLRAKLVPKEAKLHSALMIAAALGGVRIFGLIGVILGPVLMIIIVTTIELFIAERHRIATILKTPSR